MKPNLAETLADVMTVTFPKYGSPKYDGIRGMTQMAGVKTRSLKDIPNVALREKFAPYQDLDGEFIWGEPNSPTVYNDTYKAVMTKQGTVENIKFYAFDTLDRRKPFALRLSDLLTAQNELSLHSDIVVVPQTLINNMQELVDYYDLMIRLGYEGAIFRNPSAMYKEGRSTLLSQDMLKYKPMQDTEFTVGDVYEAMHNNNEAFINELGHTDRSTHKENLEPAGMIGGFESYWPSPEGVLLPFRIAAGKLSHDERRDIWINRERYRGRIGIFTYMPGGMKDVPRHGRFKAWRHPDDISV